jgi:hypothetical protein
MLNASTADEFYPKSSAHYVEIFFRDNVTYYAD